MQLKIPGVDSITDIRRRNVLASPKFGGSCDIDSKPYLKELGTEIIERRQPIQFTSNFAEHVHRWTRACREKELGSQDISSGNFLCNVRNNVPEEVLI